MTNFVFSDLKLVAKDIKYSKIRKFLIFVIRSFEFTIGNLINTKIWK